MTILRDLLDLACGKTLFTGDASRAQRLQAVIAALLGALLFAALWGLAAGSSSVGLALGNLYKVPMIVLLAAVAAVPAGMVTWKLIDAPYRPSDLLLTYATGVFAGTLVMAVLAPLVALYYHTSVWAGPALAVGTVGLALVVAGLIFVRGVLRRVEQRGWVLFVPVAVFFLMHVAVLVQLIAVAQPILPETTIFDGGVDQWVH